MKRNEIIKLSKKNIDFQNLEKAKNILNKEYEISSGQYSALELKKALDEHNPVIIENHLLIGYDPDKNGNYRFVNHLDEPIYIDKMVKAIIVDDIKVEPVIDSGGDIFLIPGKHEWDMKDSETNILYSLRLGTIFIPAHSAVLNLLEPDEDMKRKKIVSMLHGANINVYSAENAFDNIIHEIGHLFWRTSVTVDEKIKFRKFFDTLKPSAIYNYSWERNDEEETFCTIYKWYVKSILINTSFYNILEHEEPRGLKLLQGIFDRIAKDRMTTAIFNDNKELVFEYLHPRLDSRTGRYIIKKDIKNEVENLAIPNDILNDIQKVENNVEYINFEKAIVPIKNRKIDCELFESNLVQPMQKASSNKKPIIYFDMDGVVADFVHGYKEAFNRDAYKDDSFTIGEQCITRPDFFRNLPLIDKGFELYNDLKNDYQIVFLTTPMEGLPECKRDKVNWIEKYFGQNNTIIFSNKKCDYVIDEKSILIDDMKYNLDAWDLAGGTAINAKQSNEKIKNRIDQVMHCDGSGIKEQLQNMEVNTEPTEAQKESGNYKKGEITFKGMTIKIENPKGSWRFGIGDNGKKWATKMKSHYGYIVHDGAGIDGDKIDVFIGPKVNASKAFVINQRNPMTGMFDEHKIILGVETADEAEELYLSNYQKGWEGLDSIKSTNTKQIREWLKEGKFNEPF